MAIILMDAQRAAKVALKEERTRDAALAMQEYKAEELAVRANIARLKTVRFAKEVASRQDTKTKEQAKEDDCAGSTNPTKSLSTSVHGRASRRLEVQRRRVRSRVDPQSSN